MCSMVLSKGAIRFWVGVLMQWNSGQCGAKENTTVCYECDTGSGRSAYTDYICIGRSLKKISVKY